MSQKEYNAIKVTPYEDTNETINRYKGDDTLWVVDGYNGRRIIIAETAGDAKEIYASRKNKWAKPSLA